MTALPLTPRQLRMVICLLLAAGTAILYWPVTHHDFINVDDLRFVPQNAQVRAGLTWHGIMWAMTSFYAETWQPVTWLTHMVDCQLYGLNAGGHHLTSLLFHVANTLLLFVWLENLTKATARSAFVAALFAWHPLHVESVAWICERKDLVSMFFMLLSLMAYSRYARKPAVGMYLLALVLFALALMAKPMVVTLPCILLLLDFWPFNRLELPWVRGGQNSARETRQNSGAKLVDPIAIRKALVLIAEKIPFFILGLAMTAVTIYAEKAGGTLATLAGLPLQTRAANAAISYLSYLSETFWPTHLAFYYPYSFDLPPLSVFGATLVLLLWTACCLLRLRQQPYLLVGWLWWFGTLVPTIGLIQFCAQSKADRYMYMPSIGLFIMLVWGITDVLKRRPAGRKLLPVVGGVALVGCLATCSDQISYWQDSITVSRHAIEVTRNNYVAYDSLGSGLYERGLKQEAIQCYAEAVRIFPQSPQPQFNLGVALMDAGRYDEAVEHLAAAVKIMPDKYELRNQLGSALLATGDRGLPEAVHQFTEALRLMPDSEEVQGKLAVALAQQGKITNALPHFAEAVRLDPTNSSFRFDYGLALLQTHQPEKAAGQFAEELRLAPEETKAHYRLAQALEQQGDLAGAVAHYREALRQVPDFPEAKTAMDQILSAHPDLK